MESEIDQEQIKFVPKTVLRRKALLEEIVEVLSRKRWKSLDETKPDDLKRVVAIIEDLHPEATHYKAIDYARTAIRLRNKRKTG